MSGNLLFNVQNHSFLSGLQEFHSFGEWNFHSFTFREGTCIYFIIHSGQLIFHLVLLTAWFRCCFMFVFTVYLSLYLCIALRNRLPRQMVLYKFIIIITIIVMFVLTAWNTQSTKVNAKIFKYNFAADSCLKYLKISQKLYGGDRKHVTVGFLNSVSTCISSERDSLIWRGHVQIVHKRRFSLDTMLNCIYSNLICTPWNAMQVPMRHY